MDITKDLQRQIDDIFYDIEKRENKANNRWLLEQKILFFSILMLLAVTFIGTPLFPWAIRYHYRWMTPFLISGAVSAIVIIFSIDDGQQAKQVIRSEVLISTGAIVVILLTFMFFSADSNSFEKMVSERKIKIWATDGFSQGIDKKGSFVRKLSSLKRFKELDEGNALINKKISFRVVNNANAWDVNLSYSGRLSGNKVNNLTRVVASKTILLGFIKGEPSNQKVKAVFDPIKKKLVVRYHKTKGPEGLPLFNLPIFNR